MCGIIGYIGQRQARSTLLTGLKNLEYRGYDSAGIALKDEREIALIKREGEVNKLEQASQELLRDGVVGIGHTRWSTHGPPSDENAHPHTDCSNSIAVVHNGIIDNYDELRSQLRARGHEFTSETDTEVVPHLVEEYVSEGQSPEAAFRNAIAKLDGSYAIAMVLSDSDAIYAARSGSPLVVGVGDDGNYLASDVPAFLEFTEDVIYLEDGDFVTLSADGCRITDIEGRSLDRPINTVEWSSEGAEKDGFPHYMLKEIHEQPTAIERATRGRTLQENPVTDGGDAADELSPEIVSEIDSIQFVACGTSYHAALYGEQLLSSRGIPANTALASEFVTSPPPLSDRTLVVGVTQSGETADTLEALRAAKSRGFKTLAVTNVIGSTAARECDEALFIRAGPEIGVAATKTFSSQVATLAQLAAYLSDEPDDLETMQNELAKIPEMVQQILDENTAESLAEYYRNAESYFFVGRGIAHPVALEGALKLKEISYEHAEGFPAGELKHGPLALVTPQTPVFAIITGSNIDRMRGTIREVAARGAPVVAVAPESISLEGVESWLTIPETTPELSGILTNVQLQLFSYHTATLLERSVDKPRNLAKSVTVE